MAARPTSDFTKLVDDAEKAVLDGAYVAVGLGVLGFQRAQVRRHELAKRLEGTEIGRRLEALDPSELARRLEDLDLSQVSAGGQQLVDGVAERVGVNLGTARTQLVDLARTIDERVAPTRRQLDEQVDALEERLPAGARDVIGTLRTAVEVPGARLRAAVGLD